MKRIQILVCCVLVANVQTFNATEKDKDENKSSAFNSEKKVIPKIETSKAVKAKDAGPKAISTGDKIYTWIDKYGNKIYSDVAREGADVMVIEKGTDYESLDNKADWSKIRPKVVATDIQPYSHFEIASPSNDATVRNNAGNLQVALDIRPKLGLGHKVVLDIDGVTVSDGSSSILSVNNVNRGSHNLVARIIDADDKTIISTDQITIFLHRAIIKKSN